MMDILAFCEENGKHFWEYVQDYEDDDLWDYLEEVWHVMKNAVLRGLENEGVLPGIIKLPRKASIYMIRARGVHRDVEATEQIIFLCVSRC